MGKNIQEKVIRYVDSLGRAGMKFELGRITRVLNRLNNPQSSFPSIHLAGTNGKGSVGAMLAQTLQDQGLKVGLYTSPHLISLHERFQINGSNISNAKLTYHINRVRRHLRGTQLTQYEFLTAVAFSWLASENVDMAVVETGLGGRLDATNVMGNVKLTVITNIDLEHTQWLGNTKAKIAKEKAGIIKKNVPLVTGATGEALKVILNVARKHEAPVFLPSKKDFSSHQLNLKGPHQSQNARLAYSSMKVLSSVLPIDLDKARRSIEKARWPGRFEIFRRKGKTIILDGAHNPAAMKALAQTLQMERISSFDLVFGALSDKNISTMIRSISSPACRVYVVPLPSDRSAQPGPIANESSWKSKAKAFSTLSRGWKASLTSRGKRPIVVTGSLYLVGDIRKKLMKRHF